MIAQLILAASLSAGGVGIHFDALTDTTKGVTQTCVAFADGCLYDPSAHKYTCATIALVACKPDRIFRSTFEATL